MTAALHHMTCSFIRVNCHIHSTQINPNKKRKENRLFSVIKREGLKGKGMFVYRARGKQREFVVDS